MDRIIPDIRGKGIYCLVLRNDPSGVNVGRLGNLFFRGGYHIYVGSALGRGGLKRLERHVSVSKNRPLKGPHWHIDHLLAHPDFELISVIYACTERRLECRLAESIGGKCITGFGCSDCTCRSHLFYRSDRPEKEVAGSFSRFGLQAVSIDLCGDE